MSGFGHLVRIGVPVLLLALGACAAPGGMDSAGKGTAQVTAEGVKTPVNASAALPARMLPDIPSPKELVGLQQNDVRGLLGAPSLTRTEENAQVWQYAVQGCVLHLFMYEKQGGLSVVYVAASRPSRVTEETPLSIESCLERQVIEAQTPAAAG